MSIEATNNNEATEEVVAPIENKETVNESAAVEESTEVRMDCHCFF